MPFSAVHIPLELSTSNFGRPPQNTAPSLYPPASTSTPTSSLIPAIHDPFFLPPPFIPSHQHLRDLCGDAVAYLKESHTRFEEDAKSYIVAKSREMRELEEKVRCEVETLWMRYRDGPGRGNMGERSRSPSTEPQTISPEPIRSKTFSPPPRSGQNDPSRQSRTINPVLPQASVSSANTSSSLLSASISANAFYTPLPPHPIPNQVDDSIIELSKTLDKQSDARAVAMSQVFSVLDETMGSVKQDESKVSTNSSQANGRDSWIDEERLILAKRAAVDEEESGGVTPRQTLLEQSYQMDQERRKGRGGGERSVKFAESTLEGEEHEEGPDSDIDGEGKFLLIRLPF